MSCGLFIGISYADDLDGSDETGIIDTDDTTNGVIELTYIGEEHYDQVEEVDFYQIIQAKFISEGTEEEAEEEHEITLSAENTQCILEPAETEVTEDGYQAYTLSCRVTDSDQTAELTQTIYIKAAPADGGEDGSNPDDGNDDPEGDGGENGGDDNNDDNTGDDGGEGGDNNQSGDNLGDQRNEGEGDGTGDDNEGDGDGGDNPGAGDQPGTTDPTQPGDSDDPNPPVTPGDEPGSGDTPGDDTPGSGDTQPDNPEHPGDSNPDNPGSDDPNNGDSDDRPGQNPGNQDPSTDNPGNSDDNQGSQDDNPGNSGDDGQGGQGDQGDQGTPATPGATDTEKPNNSGPTGNNLPIMLPTTGGNSIFDKIPQPLLYSLIIGFVVASIVYYRTDQTVSRKQAQ